MKLTLRLVSSILFWEDPYSAQVPGMMTMQPASVPQGTDLGANTTVNAAGIALGNRVKLRGFVDFTYNYGDIQDVGSQGIDGKEAKFNTAADVDFLLISHLSLAKYIWQQLRIPQARALVSSKPSSVTASTAISTFPWGGNSPYCPTKGTNPATFTLRATATFPTPFLAMMLSGNAKTQLLLAAGLSGLSDSQLRRNYVDGVRANFNNGRFGLSLGLHDGYWTDDDFNGDNIAVDIAASLMIIPGLEARLGYAHQNTDTMAADDDIQHFNAWLEYNPWQFDSRL